MCEATMAGLSRGCLRPLLTGVSKGRRPRPRPRPRLQLCAFERGRAGAAPGFFSVIVNDPGPEQSSSQAARVREWPPPRSDRPRDSAMRLGESNRGFVSGVNNGDLVLRRQKSLRRGPKNGPRHEKASRFRWRK